MRYLKPSCNQAMRERVNTICGGSCLSPIFPGIVFDTECKVLGYGAHEVWLHKCALNASEG